VEQDTLVGICDIYAIEDIGASIRG